jgi:hypothetical protein
VAKCGCDDARPHDEARMHDKPTEAARELKKKHKMKKKKKEKKRKEKREEKKKKLAASVVAYGDAEVPSVLYALIFVVVAGSAVAKEEKNTVKMQHTTATST